MKYLNHVILLGLLLTQFASAQFNTASPKGVSLLSQDPHARSFILRAGITNATQKAALYQLTRDLKSCGVWNRLSAFYPFVGNTAENHRHNLVSTNYAITWTNTSLHSTSGWRSNGTNSFANTMFNPEAEGVPTNSFHLYVWVNSSDATNMWLIGGVSEDYTNRIALSRSSTNLHFSVGTGGFFGVLGNTSFIPGHSLLNIAQTNVAVAKASTDNGDPVYLTQSMSGFTGVNTNIYLAGQNPTNYAYAPNTFRAASLGLSLSTNQVKSYFTAINTFQTALGRNIP